MTKVFKGFSGKRSIDFFEKKYGFSTMKPLIFGKNVLHPLEAVVASD
jgi:hypothetical protein